MEQLIEKLHKSVITGGFDIKPIKNELQNIDKRELVVYLLNTKKLSYLTVSSVFLVLPEIWKDFQLEDWMYVIRSVSRPSKYRILMDKKPCFEDIRFLYNWIGIDSIDLYQNDIEITDENKENLNKVFPSFLIDSMRNGDSYKEDFEDGTFGSINYFREMKERLINQGAKKNSLVDL